MKVVEATISFEARPDIRVDGEVRATTEITLPGGEKFEGVDLGNGAYAKLQKREGGKFDVVLFKSDHSSISKLDVSINKGAVSRLRDDSGTVVENSNAQAKDQEHIKFNKKFFSEFQQESTRTQPPSKQITTVVEHGLDQEDPFLDDLPPPPKDLPPPPKDLPPPPKDLPPPPKDLPPPPKDLPPPPKDLPPPPENLPPPPKDLPPPPKDLPPPPKDLPPPPEDLPPPPKDLPPPPEDLPPPPEDLPPPPKDLPPPPEDLPPPPKDLPPPPKDLPPPPKDLPPPPKDLPPPPKDVLSPPVLDLRSSAPKTPVKPQVSLPTWQPDTSNVFSKKWKSLTTSSETQIQQARENVRTVAKELVGMLGRLPKDSVGQITEDPAFNKYFELLSIAGKPLAKKGLDVQAEIKAAIAAELRDQEGSTLVQLREQLHSPNAISGPHFALLGQIRYSVDLEFHNRETMMETEVNRLKDLARKAVQVHDGSLQGQVAGIKFASYQVTDDPKSISTVFGGLVSEIFQHAKSQSKLFPDAILARVFGELVPQDRRLLVEGFRLHCPTKLDALLSGSKGSVPEFIESSERYDKAAQNVREMTRDFVRQQQSEYVEAIDGLISHLGDTVTTDNRNDLLRGLIELRTQSLSITRSAKSVGAPEDDSLNPARVKLSEALGTLIPQVLGLENPFSELTSMQLVDLGKALADLGNTGLDEAIQKELDSRRTELVKSLGTELGRALKSGAEGNTVQLLSRLLNYMDFRAMTSEDARAMTSDERHGMPVQRSKPLQEGEKPEMVDPLGAMGDPGMARHSISWQLQRAIEEGGLTTSDLTKLREEVRKCAPLIAALVSPPRSIPESEAGMCKKVAELFLFVDEILSTRLQQPSLDISTESAKISQDPSHYKNLSPTFKQIFEEVFGHTIGTDGRTTPSSKKDLEGILTTLRQDRQNRGIQFGKNQA